MNTLANILDWVCGIGSAIAALMWAAWGFGWLTEPPTRTSADIMVILFYFQAVYWFQRIAAH